MENKCASVVTQVRIGRLQS